MDFWVMTPIPAIHTCAVFSKFRVIVVHLQLFLVKRFNIQQQKTLIFTLGQQNSQTTKDMFQPNEDQMKTTVIRKSQTSSYDFLGVNRLGLIIGL